MSQVWIILFAPLVAALLITLFTRRWPGLSAGLSIGAILIGFILSLQVFLALGSGQVLSPAPLQWLIVGNVRIEMGAVVDRLSALMLLVGYLVFRSQSRKPTLGLEGLIGEIGEVKVKLAPSGKVFVHGEYWNAQGDGEIGIGEKVEVVGIDGMCLRVRRLSEGR